MSKVISLRNSLEPMTRSVDNSGLVVDCNQKYARMLGYTRNEVIGVNIFDHTPKTDHGRLEGILKSWKDGKAINNRKVSLLTKHGNIFDVFVTVQDVMNRSGEVVRGNNVILDCGEVLDFQELVKEDKYKSLYEESSDMYRTVNIDGIIVDCNKTYHTRLGYAKEEVIGRSLVEHTADSSVSDILIHMAKWRLTGKDNPIEIKLKTKTGAMFLTRVSATNLYGEDGALLGQNVIIRDITKEEESRIKLEQHEKEKREKFNFITGITRNLASPIKPILSNMEALSENRFDALTKKQRDVVDSTLRDVVSLDRLINCVLDIHMLEYGQMTFEFGEFDVEDLLADVKNELPPPMKNNGRELAIQNSLESKVTSDYVKVHKILSNLLHDATGGSPADPGSVSIAVSKSGDHVKFLLSGAGVSVPKENRENLFGRSRRDPDSAENMDYGMTNPGFMVCGGLVERLGGQLTVESDADGGSALAFTVYDGKPAGT